MEANSQTALGFPQTVIELAVAVVVLPITDLRVRPLSLGARKTTVLALQQPLGALALQAVDTSLPAAARVAVVRQAVAVIVNAITHLRRGA